MFVTIQTNKILKKIIPTIDIISTVGTSELPNIKYFSIRFLKKVLKDKNFLKNIGKSIIFKKI